MSKISATIVADSLSPQGDRLTSVLVTFPRIILSEINTHRMLSKNTSSSRAIPFKKMVEAVRDNPFIPIAWQEAHSGMQGSNYYTDEIDIKGFNQTWLGARDMAVESATELDNGEITKQLANRLLEPFMWTTMLITGPKSGWDNFFKLRCPDYEVFTLSGLYNVKSCKEARELALYPDEFKTFEIALQHNKGQAEIHIMDLAEKIYDCIQESVPTQLKPNEWHIPMISDLESLKLSTDDQIKLSVGRAANTSYTVVGDGKELTLEHAIKIHDKCKELNHSSVFEHCARAMNDAEYESFYKGQIGLGGESGWCNNLKGFIPYRYFIDNNINFINNLKEKNG